MPQEDSGLRPRVLTWTALLARWIDFAKASAALPATDPEGDRWRASAAAVVNLQAVVFALGELDALPPGDRSLARDRAELLVEASLRRLGESWRGAALPTSLRELETDARRALTASLYVGAVELVWVGAETFVVPALPETSPEGTLAVMQPGTIVMPDEPVAWWADREGPAWESRLPGCVRLDPEAAPRQVYRQFDAEGRIVRDVVVPVTAAPPAGLPLLVPLSEAGHRVGHFTLDAGEWEARQRRDLGDDPIPVLIVE